MATNAEHSERTTISLPSEMASRLSYEARRSNRSASAVVREALMAYFDATSGPTVPSFVGLAKGSAPGIAERVDEEVARIMNAKFPEIMGRERSKPSRRKRARSE